MKWYPLRCTFVAVVLASTVMMLPGASAQAPAATAAGSISGPLKALPAGPLGAAIRHGEKVVTQTQVYAKPYVGNGLNCTSCHLDNGKMPFAAPWIGISGVFPEYSSRSARVTTLQERINDCFRRSLNGKPLPQDGKEMVGTLAYMWWLSQGVPTGVDGPGRGFKTIKLPDGVKPDPLAGKAGYAAKCAACHGPDGQGIVGASGDFTFTPLWGKQSFNSGAGMARIDTAAAFIKVAMPLGQGNSLTDQEAFDIAAFVTRQPRPRFVGKANERPTGG